MSYASLLLGCVMAIRPLTMKHKWSAFLPKLQTLFPRRNFKSFISWRIGAKSLDENSAYGLKTDMLRTNGSITAVYLSGPVSVSSARINSAYSLIGNSSK